MLEISTSILTVEEKDATKTFYNLVPLYDQENKNSCLDGLLSKLGFVRLSDSTSEEKKGLFDVFKN